MPYDPQSIFPPGLISEEVREIGRRAVVETAEARAHARDLLVEAQRLLQQLDALLARRAALGIDAALLPLRVLDFCRAASDYDRYFVSRGCSKKELPIRS